MNAAYTRPSWEGRYRDLVQLSLPGAALVIDVRKGSEYEPPLVWNLATELDDFLWEMELYQVYRWRRLKYCIALLKLSQLPERTSSGNAHISEEEERARYEEVLTYHDYTLTDPRGSGDRLPGKQALTRALIQRINHVNMNRLSAIRDGENWFPTGQRVDREQPVVTVCFVADATDENSMRSAATYSLWLKGDRQLQQAWDVEMPDLRTVVMCFNVDLARHTPGLMYRRLRSAERTSTLDKTILLSCYGEHGVRLTNEIQSHQVELILYTLLLSGWEMLKEQNKEKHFRRANGELVDYWPLDLIGVSSLEYSARWGMRWLDYKLVEEVCQIFLTSESMQEEKEPDLATHRAWLDWQEAVAAFVEKLVPGTSALQVVHEMETLLHLLNRPGKFEAHLPKPEQIEQFYKRLTEAMQEMPGVIRQLQLSLPDERNELYRTLKANWQTLLNHTTRLPAALLFPPEQSDVRPFLFNPHGLLPRAQRSVRLLGRALSEIQRQAENLPDLTMSREWVKLAAHRLPLQARAARTRQKRSIYARHQQELLTQIRADLELVRAFLRAQVEQTLLGEAGLISHEGHLSRYMQGLCELVKMVQGAVVAARQMHENARNRLSMSLSLMQPGSWKGDVQLNPRCRADLLDWDAMKGACERLKEDLHRPARPLALLGYCLLSLLSGTDPACLLPDLVDPAPPETEPPFGRAQQSGAERQEARDRQKKLLRLQEAGTLIVTMALCSRQVSVSVKAYQELVKDYLHQVSQLALDFTSLTRILEQIQTRGLPAGTNQHGVDSPEGLPLGRENTFEVLLAGWMNNEYITLHEYADILGRNELFARMLSADASPAAIFTDLNERNIMLGNIAALYRTTKNAYLLVPGDNGPRFEQEIASDTMHMRDYLQVLSFPDIEKMIYLKVDHIAYPQDELLLSSEKEGA